MVTSQVHSPMQLRTILDWEIVPELRSIPGITEINTQGDELKPYQVLTTLVVLPGILYMFLRHQAPWHFREERTPTPVC